MPRLLTPMKLFFTKLKGVYEKKLYETHEKKILYNFFLPPNLLEKYNSKTLWNYIFLHLTKQKDKKFYFYKEYRTFFNYLTSTIPLLTKLLDSQQFLNFCKLNNLHINNHQITENLTAEMELLTVIELEIYYQFFTIFCYCDIEFKFK